MISKAWCRYGLWAFLPCWAMVALPAHAQPTQAPAAILTHLWADTALIITRSHTNPRIPIEITTQPKVVTLAFGVADTPKAATVEYAYRLNGVDNGWHYFSQKMPQVSYIGLAPGAYTLYLRSRQAGKPWEGAATLYTLRIVPGWWQTTWFRIMLVVLGIAFIAELFVLRLNALRKKDREQAEVKMRMMELQDSALRAQMNPHFIFNCLNSIKRLVQEGNNETAVTYLTTFTKLIRSLLQHADKRYVTAYEELETCRLYLDLEALRFSGRFAYQINTEPSLDLKSVEVPTLVIQPIVENAIWHGLIPKEGTGHLWIDMRSEGERLVCVVDDDGIGREASKRMNQHKAGHISKGVSLTHDRIDLYNLLKGNDATIEITDKTEAEGKPCGTRVTITFLMH